MTYIFVTWIGWCMACIALVTIYTIIRGVINPDYQYPDGTGVGIIFLGIILGSIMAGVTLL